MNSLILLFIIVAAFALVYWGMSQLPLPPVVRTVIIVVMGLIALVFIYNMFVGGGLHLSLR
jgi:intracellular septation protein A